MASSLVSKNAKVNGVRTSLRLEPMMWDALAEICRREKLSRNELLSMIDGQRVQSSLTAATRVFVMNYYRSAATERGHERAGHGQGSHDHLAGMLKPSHSDMTSPSPKFGTAASVADA